MNLVDPPLLFTYGTLKRGFPNHDVMQRAGGLYLGSAETLENLPLIFQHYPYILDLPGEGHRIRGEVFLISKPEGWALLDHLEDHPFEYERRLRTVLLGREKVPVPAYIYFANQGWESLKGLPFLAEFTNNDIQGR
jgi:gamma-glutamylaminecyclotransferase